MVIFCILEVTHFFIWENYIYKFVFKVLCVRVILCGCVRVWVRVSVRECVINLPQLRSNVVPPPPPINIKVPGFTSGSGCLPIRTSRIVHAGEGLPH